MTEQSERATRMAQRIEAAGKFELREGETWRDVVKRLAGEHEQECLAWFDDRASQDDSNTTMEATARLALYEFDCLLGGKVTQ